MFSFDCGLFLANNNTPMMAEIIAIMPSCKDCVVAVNDITAKITAKPRAITPKITAKGFLFSF